MTPFPDCPTAYHADRAAVMMRSTLDVLCWIAEGSLPDDDKDRLWNGATGYLQDALAELGFDLRPLRTPAPATAEALFDDAAYSHSRGGM